MKQVLIYSLKVWLTSLAILLVSTECLTFYRLAQPDHSKDFLDPFFAALVCIILTLVFLPAFIAFRYLVEPLNKRVTTIIKTKLALSGVASVLVLVTVVPFLLLTYPDFTYLWIGLFYTACMLVGIWMYRLPHVETDLIL